MNPLFGILFVVLAANTFADCVAPMSLHGFASVKTCNPDAEICIDGTDAVHAYADRSKTKDDPTMLQISIHASPWRFYDGQMRILNVDDLAELARPSIAKGVKRVVLNASWTGVAPVAGGKSLAQQLSAKLNGIPVSGKKGFLWLAKDGSARTTQQAFTIRKGSGPYQIVDGDEVLVSLTAGWPAEMESVFIKEGDAEGIMRAGAGWDVFYLCPERALQAFETAARLAHPIAAYNAAMIRLERKAPGDTEAAKAWLAQAAAAGDKKAEARLLKLR